MKRYDLMFSGILAFIFLLSFQSVLHGEEGGMHGMKAHDTKGVEQAAENVVIDPVCGMKITPEAAAGKVEYKGKTYYFCMDSDKEAFEKDPEKYMARMTEQKHEKGMPMGHEGMEAEHHEMEGHEGEAEHPMEGEHHEMEGQGHEHEMMHGGHWMAPEEEAKRPNPVEATPGSIAAGKLIFADKCAICHGANGAGDGVLAGSLDPKPADLTSKHTQIHPDGDLFYKISKGRGAMPAWDPALSEQDRWNLVNYIRTLGEPGEVNTGTQAE